MSQKPFLTKCRPIGLACQKQQAGVTQFRAGIVSLQPGVPQFPAAVTQFPAAETKGSYFRLLVFGPTKRRKHNFSNVPTVMSRIY